MVPGESKTLISIACVVYSVYAVAAGMIALLAPALVLLPAASPIPIAR